MKTYDEIKKIHPEIKVLFMSGYTVDIVLDKGIQEKEFNFISKPLSPNTLLRERIDIEWNMGRLSVNQHGLPDCQPFTPLEGATKHESTALRHRQGRCSAETFM